MPLDDALDDVLGLDDVLHAGLLVLLSHIYHLSYLWFHPSRRRPSDSSGAYLGLTESDPVVSAR